MSKHDPEFDREQKPLLSQLELRLSMFYNRLKAHEIQAYKSAAALDDAIDIFEALHWADASAHFTCILDAFADLLSEAVGGIT